MYIFILCLFIYIHTVVNIIIICTCSIRQSSILWLWYTMVILWVGTGITSQKQIGSRSAGPAPDVQRNSAAAFHGGITKKARFKKWKIIRKIPGKIWMIFGCIPTESPRFDWEIMGWCKKISANGSITISDNQDYNGKSSPSCYLGGWMPMS